MTQKESMKVKGRVHLIHKGPDGEIKDEREFPNVITNLGLKNAAALILTDVTGFAYDWIGIGTSSATASATDTALTAEITGNGGARATADGTLVTTSVTDDTAQLEVTFSFTGSETVRESGIFTALSSGTMGARQTFSDVSVTSGDSLTIRWKLTMS